MDKSTRDHVRTRADNRCEYCCLHQDLSPLASLHVEHIIPKKHGGSDDPSNLALACIDCNLAKGSNIAGLDPETSVLTRLFNPRVDKWIDHFAWNGSLIAGRSVIGRTTIQVMNLNSDDQIEVRSFR